MGLIIGYNPPIANAESKLLQVFKVQAGTTNTAFTRAAEVITGAITTNLKSFLVVALPPILYGEGSVRVDLEMHTSGASLSTVKAYGILFNPGVGVDLTSYLTTLIASDLGILFTSVNNAYEAKTATITFKTGYRFIALVIGNAAGTNNYTQNVTIKFDNDTPYAYAIPWTGSL